MAIRVRLDRARCIGAESCIQIAPTAFRWKPDELGKVELLDPSSVEEDLLREAAVACPTLAIELVEVDESGRSEPGLRGT